ncbi:MAG: hypothetical protein M1546_07650 [Chloroflexi bacterium]|nr:hypothetical protein [Chloroflexota bacterium]
MGSSPLSFQKGVVVACVAVLLVGCGGSAAPQPAPSPSAEPTQTSEPAKTSAADLSAIKSYLLDKGGQLKASTAKLAGISNQYYDLAKAAGFDYPALWSQQADAVTKVIQDARAEWMVASPLYEQIEGIVAGVPSLANFDVILDSGASAAEGGENVVSFDLTLPDGRTLPKPGNLFGVTESTLWGTFDEFIAKGVEPDFDGNGKLDFAERLPDANVLKSGTEALGQVVAAHVLFCPTA